MVTITGNHDGSSAVDYTVNPATGFPWATGPRNLCVPVQPPAARMGRDHRHPCRRRPARRRAPPRAARARDSWCTVALSDVAFAMVGNLGKIAEAQVCRRERQKEGNYLYGAFGRDFLTKDDRRVMVVALTPHQWRGARRGDRTARGLRAGRASDGRGPRPRRATASPPARCSARS